MGARRGLGDPLLPRPLLKRAVVFLAVGGRLGFSLQVCAGVPSTGLPSPLHRRPALLAADRPASCWFCLWPACWGRCQGQPGGLVLSQLPPANSFHKCPRAVNWLFSLRSPPPPPRWPLDFSRSCHNGPLSARDSPGPCIKSHVLSWPGKRQSRECLPPSLLRLLKKAADPSQAAERGIPQRLPLSYFC